MLKSITIENFKSFGKKQSLPLASMTLMIGANASGKITSWLFTRNIPNLERWKK